MKKNDEKFEAALDLIAELHKKAKPGSSERISAQNFLMLNGRRLTIS